MANPLGTPHIKRFQFLGVLGTGAQGLVVLARDHADASSEPIGLKVLRRATDAASLTRLREEARILAWLSHPNIVRVHRLLEKDGLPIVVMDHVQGASVQELIGAGTPLPEPVALEVAHRAALALDAAFNLPGPDGEPMRIVHRDIKPGNLLLSVGGEVKVVDFGTATRAIAAIGVPEEDPVQGTLGYVAPERRGGGADTPAVDVYALGCTLYGMLSGQLLVPSPTVEEHDATVARALAHLAPREEVRALVAEMCAFAAEERPAVPDLAQRLAALVALVGAPDLKAYATANVAPIAKSRAKKNPRATHWPDLAFLEAGVDVQEIELEVSGPKRDLALRSVHPPDDIEPMLATLQPRPAWALWRKQPPPEALVEALEALRGSRDARAVTRAHELTSHPDPRVVEAAWELLAAAC